MTEAVEKIMEQVEFFGSAKASYAVAHAANEPDAAANFATEAVNALLVVKEAVTEFVTANAALLANAFGGQDAEKLTARLAEMENAITWHVSCLGCAANLDNAHEQTCRAEKAEQERDTAQKLADHRGALLEKFTGELSAANVEAAKMRAVIRQAYGAGDDAWTVVANSPYV